MERGKLVVEPAGGAGVAALLAGVVEVEPPVVAVLSGGNIDPLLMLRIIRHGMAAAGRYLTFGVRVPDVPGSLARLLADLAGVDANVIEVRHNRNESSLSVHETEIVVDVETKGPDHREEVLGALRADGYTPLLR
jgi:threonine dehydratase